MRSKLIFDKKAISPVITTVLMIVLVVILASIIFIWAKGFIKEQISKTVGEESRPIDEACSAVNLEASVSAEGVAISNTGNIPVKKIGVRISGKITPMDANLAPGSSIDLALSSTSGEVILIPILLGKGTKDAIKEYYCPKQYWKSLA
jgi:flagellin-like protein